MKRRVDPRRSDSGQVTPFVVVMATAFIFCLGLVLDGGGVLHARNRADTLAQEAARAGVQQLDWAAYRSGEETRLDPVMAAQAANSFLTSAGVNGTVSVDGDTVTVTSSVDYGFTLLPLGGVTVDGTASAQPFSSDPVVP